MINVAFSFIPKDFKLPKLENGGKHWAFLTAGSVGWFNYRHQADVCHAYHVLRNHGIPDERIIVMMGDDIAYNKENPTPGIIINRPNGTDVYKGVVKDYTGMDVNPDNFLKVLSGDEEGMMGIGSGRVIKSGKNDNIFVNFVDHGAPGLIAFNRTFLHAIDLMEVLFEMHKDEKFGKMLFYLETCESGSMFKSLLPKDKNILAVTAANSTQSSYACYMDKKRKTFLGDVFSVMWMQDSDVENLNDETIDKQFKIVKQKTNTSNVMHYGNLEMGDMFVSEFQGKKQSAAKSPMALPDPMIDAVPSREAELEALKMSFDAATTYFEKEQLGIKIDELEKKKSEVGLLIKHIVGKATETAKVSDKMLYSKQDLTKHDCYKNVVEFLFSKCSSLKEEQRFNFALQNLYAFVNMCEENIPAETIMEATYKVCDLNFVY